MDTKEKLVELINIGQECPDDRGPFDLDCQGCKYEKVRDCQLARLADYLIAHGVTVQGTGCVYCEEDSEGYRKTLGAFSITNPFHRGEYFLNTGHCKPRQIYFCPMCGRKFGEC